MKKQFPESQTRLHRFLDPRGEYRLLVLEGRALGKSLAEAHRLSGDFSGLFRDSVDAAAILSSDLKQTMKLIFQVKWEHGGYSLEADWNGHIRGYVRDAGRIEAEYHRAPVLGGTMAIIRLIGAHPGYTGYSTIFGFNLRSALEGHFSTSEQMESHFHFAENFSAMIQRLPSDRPGHTAAESESSLKADFASLLPGVAAWIGSRSQGRIEPGDPALKLEDNSPLSWLGYDEKLISCTCSREKITTYLGGVSPVDLHSLYDEGPWPVVINCDNCASEYQFSRDQIGAIIEGRR